MISSLHAAVQDHWYGNNLDERCVEYREGSDAEGNEHLTLNEDEAGPGTPMPYCVYDLDTPRIAVRMSQSGPFKNQIRDIGLTFTVHARQTSSLSAKEVAGKVVEEIMKIWGGHDTVSPIVPSLDRGKILIVQYQNDFPERESDTNYSWTVSYLIRMETTVAVPV